MDIKTSMENLSFEDYKARPGINNSSLNHFRRSPAHYKAYTELPDKKTPAMGFGLLAHALLLQPDEYLPRLETGPTKSRDTQKWREAELDNPEAVFVTEEEKSQLVGMATAIQRNKPVVELFKNSHSEQSLFASHQKTGLAIKGRLDLLSGDGKTILDLKTCEDARESAFERTVAKFGYHFQAAYYKRLAKLCGLTHSRFVFLAVEKRYPHGVMMHELEVVSSLYADEKNEECLVRLKECLDKNEWPGYDEQIQTITLPSYAIEMEDDL